MEFEWDASKAAANVRKHGVSFREAESVFGDRNAIVLYDDNHSITEDRYISIGFSDRGRLLTVVYTERDGKTRIISARTATKSEAEAYAKA
jgi:uncharacterized DUF497 family protein